MQLVFHLVAFVLMFAALSVQGLKSTFGSSFSGRGRTIAMMAKSAMPANPVAVVTGASRGIGKAIALALADSGCKVVVNYASNEAVANEVVGEAKARAESRGGTAVAIRADCSKHEEVQSMFSKITKEVRAVVYRKRSSSLII